MNFNISKEWLRRHAEKDDKVEISAGRLDLEDLIAHKRVMTEPTCNHVSDGRRCGKPQSDSIHWQIYWTLYHKFEPGRPEEPKVDDEILGTCWILADGHGGKHVKTDSCSEWRAEAIAPEPKPEQLSEYRTGYRDGLAQGIFDQQMDDAIKRGEINLTSEAEGVTASESSLVECRCNCNPFCGCLCHKTGAEGAVKPDRDFMSAEEYSKTEDWFRRSANGKIEGSDCFDFAEAYLQAYLNRAPDQQEGSQK